MCTQLICISPNPFIDMIETYYNKEAATQTEGNNGTYIRTKTSEECDRSASGKDIMRSDNYPHNYGRIC